MSFHPSRSQRGQNMVEFALVGPFFLVLILAILEAALFINARITLDNAAREGARIAAVCGDATSFHYGNGDYTCVDAAKQAVQDHMGILSVDPAVYNVIVKCVPTGPACPQGDNLTPAGSTVRVDVTYTYAYYLGSFVGTAGPITSLDAMAQEVSQQ